jgi:hypothetical protein
LMRSVIGRRPTSQRRRCVIVPLPRGISKKKS